MEFGAEEERVDPGALQIGGQCMKFSARIGKVPFAQLGDDDAAALGAYFQAIELDRRVAEAVVGLVETFGDAWMLRMVEALRAQQAMETAQSQRNLGEGGVARRSPVARGRMRKRVRLARARFAIVGVVR
jgi:hypothetical protein